MIQKMLKVNEYKKKLFSIKKVKMLEGLYYEEDKVCVYRVSAHYVNSYYCIVYLKQIGYYKLFTWPSLYNIHYSVLKIKIFLSVLRKLKSGIYSKKLLLSSTRRHFVGTINNFLRQDDPGFWYWAW